MNPLLPFTPADLCAHGDALRRLAHALLADAELARDAVQEAYATALERPPRSGAALRAWLEQVVRRHALDLRRSRRNRTRREELAARPEATPPDAAESLAVQHEILAAVRALREPYRTAVWLRYYEDLTPTAIAARLGEPVKTIKTRLWRALRRLREELDGRKEHRDWRAALVPLAVASPDGRAIGAAWAIGAWIMQMTKTTLAVAGVLVAAGLWLLWSRLASGGVEPGIAGAAPQSRQSESVVVAQVTSTRREPLESVTAASAPSEPYGSLLVRAVWHDGTPAEGVAILLEAVGEPALDRNDLRVVTDAAGVAWAGRLHAGTVKLSSERGGTAQATVVAGHQQETQFALPPGIDVEGVVEDAASQPVPGARIWLATGKEGWLGGRVVSTSDQDGGFRIRSMDRRHSLGALAAGFAPSELVDLEDVAPDPKQSSIRVRLRVVRKGAAIEGQVLDEHGRPVAGALVAVGSGKRGMWEGPGHQREYWTPEVLVSEAEGRFRCEGIEPGVIPLTVRADGHALWTGSTPCAPGAMATVVVTLTRGVMVHGVVADEQGEPVAGAVVVSLGQPVIKALLAYRPRDLEDRLAFARPMAMSDAAGRYRLECVPAGELHLLASKSDPVPGTGNARHRGACQHQATARTGQELEWNPILSLGLTIQGRVLRADGKPWMTTLEATPERPAEGAELLFAWGNAEGHFVFSHCADVPYTVALGRAGQPAGLKWVYQAGVQPGGPEIVLRIPPVAAAQPGEVQGRVVDSGRRVSQPSELRVSLMSPEGWRQAPLTGDRFALAGLPPMRYRVMVQDKDELVCAGPWFELAPGQHLDVGDLVTEPGASISVGLRVPPGLELGTPRGDLRVAGGGWRSLRWDGQRLRADNVTIGSHRLSVSGGAWHTPPRDVTLVQGQDNEFEVELTLAVVRNLEIAFPLPDLWQLGSAVLRDTHGKIVGEYVGVMSTSVGMRPVTWRAPQPFGTFTLEVTTDGGHQKSWPVDLSDPATASAVLRFSLR